MGLASEKVNLIRVTAICHCISEPLSTHLNRNFFNEFITNSVLLYILQRRSIDKYIFYRVEMFSKPSTVLNITIFNLCLAMGN